MSRSFTIRPARPEDVPAVVSMVYQLAEYERAAPRECQLTEEHLRAALFAPAPAVFCHLAIDDSGGKADASGEPLGMSLWFLNFSTWTGRHGIYLEDLYVTPSARGRGVGRALLGALAQECVRRGYARLDWWVLHWNPARDFYAALGAVPMDDWIPYRLTGGALERLAEATGQEGTYNLAPTA